MDVHRHSIDGDTPRRKSVENPNVFADEFAIDASAGEAGDDARSSAVEAPSSSGAARASPTPSSGDRTDSDPVSPFSVHRSSTYKPRLSEDPFLSRRERATPAAEANASASSARYPQRASSTASSYASTSHAQSSSSHAQPLHPYGLYQQNTAVTRTPSVATDSTVRPLSITSSTTQRPTHPYALYSQNGIIDDDVSASSLHQDVPIGFPGRAAVFHRRLGPDGEDHDIVGPDGHTEQLPPYSQFPEDGVARMAVSTAPTSPDSPDRDDQTWSRQQTNASTFDSSSQTLQASVPSVQAGSSEKSWNEKTWKERRRTKVCGGQLPCWMLTFIIVCLVIIVGLVAGLVGGLVSANKKASNNVVVTRTLFDADPIATPTGVPGAPAGQWALPLGLPQEQQTGCLLNNSQKCAWTCVENGPPLQLNIKAAQSSGATAGFAQLGIIDPPNPPTYNYGSQPPVIGSSALQWVTDLDNPHEGPALHFQTQYDKQVLLAISDLSPGSSNSRIKRSLRRAVAAHDRRNAYGPPSSGGLAAQWAQYGRVAFGDQPWLCHWNGTTLEGFIYMKKNSSSAASQSAARASPTSSTTITGAPWTTASYSVPAGMTGSDLTSYLSSKWYASLSASDSESPSTQNVRRDADTSQYTSTSSSTSTPSTTTEDGSYTISATGSGTISATAFVVPTHLPLFPYLVKVEERRISGPGPRASCTRVQLLNDGQLAPVPGPAPDYANIVVWLDENDPSQEDLDQDEDGATEYKSRRRRRYRRMWDLSEFDVEDLSRRDEPLDSCHCQWQYS